MGSSSSCLPVKLSACHRARHRHSPLRREGARQELIRHHTIDINRASEDELLLLPGITRPMALRIVQYRKATHGFKHRSEILKVDGITSQVFRRICEDVTITSASSNKAKANVLPGLNPALYVDLSSVPVLTSKRAAQSIDHRQREGPLHSIDALVQVTRANDSPTAIVPPHVSISPRASLASENQQYFTPDAPDTLSLASLLLDTLPPELQAQLVTSAPPQRLPSTHSSQHASKHKLFRFASWNLQQLTHDKVKNPGVREVICQTILANNFSLIGIQEIGSKASLDLIVKELNNPTIPSVRQHSDRSRGKWRYTISDAAGQMFQGSEYLGFLYDEAVGIELQQASLLSFEAYFTRSPYITIFRVYDKFEFVFVNVHLKAKRSDEPEKERPKDEARALSVLAQAMNNTIEQKHVVIFGDFRLAPTAEDFQALKKCNYSSTIAGNTDIGLQAPKGTACLDNIWLSIEARSLTTGNAGVIRDGLTSLWIPAGWTWGGLVSDHCPIWVEFNLS